MLIYDCEFGILSNEWRFCVEWMVFNVSWDWDRSICMWSNVFPFSSSNEYRNPFFPHFTGCWARAEQLSRSNNHFQNLLAVIYIGKKVILVSSHFRCHGDDGAGWWSRLSNLVQWKLNRRRARYFVAMAISTPNDPVLLFSAHMQWRKTHHRNINLRYNFAFISVLLPLNVIWFWNLQIVELWKMLDDVIKNTLKFRHEQNGWGFYAELESFSGL